MTKNILFLFVVCVLLLSCKKKGCTDCNAVNYSASANTNDNSCEFLNEDFIGWYLVSDSILGPPSMTWEQRSYEIRVLRSDCAPNNLSISNYAKLNNRFQGFTFKVDCAITDSSITILSQNIDTKKVRTTNGIFSNDSIFFDLEFENEFGEVFLGKTFGVKKY